MRRCAILLADERINMYEDEQDETLAYKVLTGLAGVAAAVVVYVIVLGVLAL